VDHVVVVSHVWGWSGLVVSKHVAQVAWPAGDLSRLIPRYACKKGHCVIVIIERVITVLNGRINDMDWAVMCGSITTACKVQRTFGVFAAEHQGDFSVGFLVVGHRSCTGTTVK